jgi:cysteinyl-tRNA synthetase
MGCTKEVKVNKITSADKMQQLVINISDYARDIHPKFIIIPQNGCEIAFNDTNPDEALSPDYMNAIDAFAVEELFYNGNYAPDTYRIGILRKLAAKKKILVSEYITNDGNIDDAVKRNQDEGFVCFPRSEKNYHYQFIPGKIRNENADDVTKISEAKNYLYLINPSEYDNKEDFIDAISKTNFDLVAIDLFFDGDDAFTAEEINKLKIKANGGKRLVICYMNIGAAENWRYYWKKGWELHHPDFIAKKYEDYENEYWAKFWDKGWQKILYGNDDSYTKKILDAGFDGAILDNAEAYYFLFKDK